jgi:hypothetical protein
VVEAGGGVDVAAVGGGGEVGGEVFEVGGEGGAADGGAVAGVEVEGFEVGEEACGLAGVVPVVGGVGRGFGNDGGFHEGGEGGGLFEGDDGVAGDEDAVGGVPEGDVAGGVAGGGVDFPAGHEVDGAACFGEGFDGVVEAGGFGGVDEAGEVGDEAADGGVAGGEALVVVEVGEIEGVGVDGGVGPAVEEGGESAGVVEVGVGEEDGAWGFVAEELMGGGEDAAVVAGFAGVDEDEFVVVECDEVDVGDTGGDAVDVGGGGLGCGMGWGFEGGHDWSSEICDGGGKANVGPGNMVRGNIGRRCAAVGRGRTRCRLGSLHHNFCWAILTGRGKRLRWGIRRGWW